MEAGGSPGGPRSRGRTRGCELSELLHLLGRTHVLEILHTMNATREALRFGDLQRRLGISPNTLSERLRDLVGAGLLVRTPHHQIPPRVDYVATQKARELAPVFEALTDWSRRHDLRAERMMPGLLPVRRR